VNQDVVVSIVVQAMQVGLMVAMPMLGIALVVGLAVSVFQAVTQIQEQTLAFIPKVIGLVVVIAVLGPWMLGQMVSWTEALYSQIPTLVGGG
jgi:flagellar biosynthesis protein FliQ